jgi:hypothetical protein
MSNLLSISPLWFHDIYRQDKTPFDPEEITVIKQVNGK